MSSIPIINTSDPKNLYNPNQYVENRFKQTHMMKHRPHGWLIMDSWNNKVFPMDIFSVDTMKFNTEKLATWFHQKYGGSQRDLFLPWHWVIEMVNQKPYVVQTRPPMYKSNIPGFKNHFTIMIVGDGNQDIYPGLFYKQLAHMIINPWKFIPSVRMPNSKENFTFWTGENFNKDYLFKELI
jgi:hypothetical protein